MNRTMIFTLLLSVSFAGRAHCETHALATDCPALVGAYDKTILLSDTALWRDSGNLVAGNSATDKAEVPGRLGADPTDPAQNAEGAIYFNTSTQKHRVFRGGALHDLGGGGEDLLLAGSSPCDAAHAGKKALAVDLANAPVNTFPSAPPFVASLR